MSESGEDLCLVFGGVGEHVVVCDRDVVHVYDTEREPHSVRIGEDLVPPHDSSKPNVVYVMMHIQQVSRKTKNRRGYVLWITRKSRGKVLEYENIVSPGMYLLGAYEFSPGKKFKVDDREKFVLERFIRRNKLRKIREMQFKVIQDDSGERPTARLENNRPPSTKKRAKDAASEASENFKNIPGYAEESDRAGFSSSPDLTAALSSGFGVSSSQSGVPPEYQSGSAESLSLSSLSSSSPSDLPGSDYDEDLDSSDDDVSDEEVDDTGESLSEITDEFQRGSEQLLIGFGDGREL